MRALLLFVLFTTIGLGIFLATGQGAVLTCSAERSTRADFPDCYLRTRTLVSEREEKFSRAEIVAVEWSVATQKSQHRKTSEDFWEIKFKRAPNLPLTARGVAWPRGTLNLKSARELLLANSNPRPQAHSLALVSYGLTPWFLGLLAGSIGWVLWLVGWAKPVQKVSAPELKKNRLTNLALLLGATGVAGSLWWSFFRVLEKFLAG